MQTQLGAFKRRLLISTACIISLLTCTSALAQFTLNASDSSVNFLSTKNVNITESHTFDRLSGSLTDSGELTIEIDLTSVNTLIPIRNERMQKMLFNVSEYTTATFSAKIDEALLTLESGQSAQADVVGTLSISGLSKPATFHVRVTSLQGGQLMATTTKPSIINANDFELNAGLEALREVAMLQNISTTVPLSFSVVFDKNNQ